LKTGANANEHCTVPVPDPVPNPDELHGPKVAGDQIPFEQIADTEPLGNPDVQDKVALDPLLKGPNELPDEYVTCSLNVPYMMKLLNYTCPLNTGANANEHCVLPVPDPVPIPFVVHGPSVAGDQIPFEQMADTEPLGNPDVHDNVALEPLLNGPNEFPDEYVTCRSTKFL
jgi:hypothetical protein